jgi:cysteinyl-tRNA synthetase
MNLETMTEEQLVLYRLIQDDKSAGFVYLALDQFVNKFIKLRSEYRKNKDFAKADEIRAFLNEHGIVLEDLK